jgi:hypothetical protein
MDRESVRTVVRTTLAVLSRVCRRTRTQTDDVMAAILQANEERIVDVVVQLLEGSNQPPTDEQIVQALERAGIRV